MMWTDVIYLDEKKTWKELIAWWQAHFAHQKLLRSKTYSEIMKMNNKWIEKIRQRSRHRVQLLYYRYVLVYELAKNK